MTPLSIIIGVLAVVVLYIVFTFNGLVTLRNRVKEAFSDTGVQQKRRHNIIPNLIETVKGYAKHEKGVFEEVTKARTQAMEAGKSGDIKAMQKSENMLSSTLKSLFAVAESYPDLKASGNFKHLQEELVDAEDKIMAARRFYNNNVQQFNTKIEQFPSNVIANMFKFEQRVFFEVEDAATAVPEVKF